MDILVIMISKIDEELDFLNLVFKWSFIKSPFFKRF